MRLRFQLAAWMMLWAAPALAATDDAACTAPNALRPIVATHTQPPYPEMSVMTKEQGTTLLEVAIGADGVPTDTTVVTSSGSIRLDQAAQDHVKANWRWVPPTFNCKSMAVKTRVSILWNLHNADNAATQVAPPTVVMDAKDYPPDALARHEQGTVVLSIYVLTTGQVVLSRVIQSSGFPDLDTKSQELVKTLHWSPASLDGHPVNTSLVVLSVWKQP
jgi:TonB family protein